MKRCLHMLSALALILVGAGNALATPIETDLVFLLGNNSTITAGDKLFDRWYVDGDTDDVDPGDISIVALADGGLDPGPGLRFVANGGVFSVEDDERLEYTIGFRVTVLDPNLRVKDNSLTLVEWDVSAEDDEAGVSIEEWIGTAQGLNDLGIKAVYDYQEWDDDETKVFDSAEFAPRTEIWVEKHIGLFADDPRDRADLYVFEQRFSQEPAVVVPEPATMGLSLLSLVAVGWSACRRRRASQA